MSEEKEHSDVLLNINNHLSDTRGRLVPFWVEKLEIL